MIMNACDGQQFPHKIITKLLKESLRTYLKKLNMEIKIFHHTKETGKILNKTTSQLLIMSYFHQRIVRK